MSANLVQGQYRQEKAFLIKAGFLLVRPSAQ